MTPLSWVTRILSSYIMFFFFFPSMVNPQQGHEEHIGHKMSSRRFSTTWSGVLFIIKESTFWTWSRLDISATSPSVAAGNYQPHQLDWVLITYVIFWLNMQHCAHDSSTSATNEKYYILSDRLRSEKLCAWTTGNYFGHILMSFI